LKRFIGFKGLPGVDFSDITFISVKFSWGFEPHKTRTTGSGAPDPHGIGAYDSVYTTCYLLNVISL